MSKKSRDRAAAKAPGGVSPSPEPETFFVRRGALLAGGIVVLAALIAYHNSFSGPFILDDPVSITENSSIRHFGSALTPPADAGVGGRPFLNLTFALNYALGGLDVWGYHAVNWLIHALAGLTLFGLVRRTIRERPTTNVQQPMSKANNTIFQEPSFREDATLLALAVAVIWVVHPLQTEAVTYVSQRAESLMGLFYLLTLYCFIRSQESGARSQEKRSGFRPLASNLWPLASICCCLLGAMSKETIVTAPVMIFLYDRTFVAGSFLEAWRRRWRYYLGLASMGLLMAGLMAGLHQRGVGFDQGTTWPDYALTSCRSVVRYLGLAIWPHPLVFDYGFDVVHDAMTVRPFMLVLGVLVASVVIALWRWPVVGFAGAWFFLILAPTTSIVPVAGQPMAEHRMYLSLAAVIGLGVLGLNAWMGRRSLILFGVIAVGLCGLSIRRNEDYRSAWAIWSDTAAKLPGNARAHYVLGNVLAQMPGQLPEAISHYEKALEIEPDYAEAHNNLGVALAKIPGRWPEAISHYEAALRIKPDFAEGHNNLGAALAEIPGRWPEAISHFEAALQINPDYAKAHKNLGGILARIHGRLPEAISHYEAALRINPEDAEAHYNLGGALATIPGRLPEAISHYDAAIRIKPDYAEAHANLGAVLTTISGRLPEAISHYEAASKINPGLWEARFGFGNALLQQGRNSDACEQYEEALKLKPGYADGHVNLGVAWLRMGRLNEAIAQFEAALQIMPGYPFAQKNLEIAREMLLKDGGKDLSEHTDH